MGVVFSWVGVVFRGPGDLTLSDLAGGAGLLGLAGTVWGGHNMTPLIPFDAHLHPSFPPSPSSSFYM